MAMAGGSFLYKQPRLEYHRNITKRLSEPEIQRLAAKKKGLLDARIIDPSTIVTDGPCQQATELYRDIPVLMLYYTSDIMAEGSFWSSQAESRLGFYSSR